jgi:cell division protein ZipA
LVLPETELETQQTSVWSPELVEPVEIKEDIDFEKPITALLDDVEDKDQDEKGQLDAFPVLDLAGVENSTPRESDDDPQTLFDFAHPGAEQPEEHVQETIDDNDPYANLTLGSALDDDYPQPEQTGDSFNQETSTEPAVDEVPLRASQPVVAAIDEPEQDGSNEVRKDNRKALEKEPDPENVLVISVVSKEADAFDGPILRRIVEACGMIFGDMDIYHRFEEGEAGATQFSMANALPPGTFELYNPESMSTRAVMFFMSMEEPEDVMDAFECMLATAETVAKNLGGEMLDENRSVMRSQTMEHYRQRVRDFEMQTLKKRGR